MRTPIPERVEQLPDGSTRITLEPGRRVVCDSCDEEWTDRPESGGLLFQSKAICPECISKWEADIERFGEQRYIRGHCPAGVSFADWVRGMR